MNSSHACEALQTIANKSWTYSEYYVGERDQDMKDGYGRYHWSGAKSLEHYEGQFLQNTMHGVGEYRYRHRGLDGRALTYEGHLYNNSMHGYGVMSYADGRIFTGIYYNNLRWGPGIESYACLRENVGLWKGTRLVRLSWKPPTPNIVPDLLSSRTGRNIVALNRCILVANTKVIGEVNPGLELLRELGTTPLEATQKWIKLYPQNCTDPKSQLYDADVFDRAYYDTTIETLEVFTKTARHEDDNSQRIGSDLVPEPSKFYAWNNNEMAIHMMRHCYQHDKQRGQYRINLEEILNGPRLSFKPAAQHELDCRTVLMACYLGHINNVAQLINEKDVDPNITDIQGNSAVMYAACGDHPDIIHFLFEAGAHIDNYNDACCTALGVALMNYIRAYLDIPLNNILDAILPPSDTATSGMEQFIISEWKIERSLLKLRLKTSSNKTIKSTQAPAAKKTKSILSFSSLKTNKISLSRETKGHKESQDEYEQLLTEDNWLYLNILNEYNKLVNELYFHIAGPTTVEYLFEVFDIVAEIDTEYNTEDQKTLPDIKAASKVIKDTLKPGKDLVSSNLNEKSSVNIIENIKNEHMAIKMLTIKQLLMDGADPSRVRNPRPALCFGILARSPCLVRELVRYGADVTEIYPESLCYSPLDIAVSGPLTKGNLDVIRILLENGAKANNRLPINRFVTSDKDTMVQEFSGPTLLHAVLSKKIDNEDNDDIRRQLLELLLEYGCDPVIQYKGRSAVDLAMSKQLDIFDIFIENPNTDLNAIINNANQTILVKMFHFPYCKTIPVAERIQMLTKLLMYGADPLLKCQNEDETYDNLFVYINKFLSVKDKSVNTSPNHEPKKAKSVIQIKKNGKPKATIKPGSKVASADEIDDYKETVNLMTNSTRLLLTRWIQAQLMKELIQIVDKHKHRHWNMILKEYKNGTNASLWLNPIRCLEIWDILMITKKRVYHDKRILKHTLCIVLYHLKKKGIILQESKLSSDEKATIEIEVAHFVHEHMKRINAMPQILKRPYVTPELTPNRMIGKFNVCFECAIPLTQAKISCELCKLIDFCSFECMAANIERLNCHQCNKHLKTKLHITQITSHPQK